MPDQHPSLVMVVFDAARAQNFGCYGYRFPTTPFLSSIADKTALYSNAICSSYWTLPSFASLFTGTYVSRHGLILEGHKLKSEYTTLAEYLSRNGYDTAGFCQNPYVSSFTDLDRGFDHFENIIPRRFDKLFKMIKKIMSPSVSIQKKSSGSNEPDSKASRTKSHDILSSKQWISKCFLDKGASDMNRRAVSWLKCRKNQNKPFFLVLLYGETHAPYCPPLPYRSKFVRDHGIVTRPMRLINQERTLYNAGQRNMNEEDISGLKALYDGSIAYSDHCVKMLYKELQRMRILDNTVFAVTADHGDNLGEHDLLSHVHCLYDTLIRIPLIVKWPKDFGIQGIKEEIVQNIDLFSTMVEILGDKEELANQLEGTSLLSKRNGGDYSFAVSELIKPFGPDAMPYREMLKKYDRRLVALRSRHHKYIWASNEQHEFYHISNDPDEKYNLYGKGDEAHVLSLLVESAKPWIDRSNKLYTRLRDDIEMSETPDIDDDIKSKLTQLGYF